MIFSETNKEVSAALAKAWAEINNPKTNKSVEVKTKTGGRYTFNYTDLAAIFDEAKRVLKENGLTIMQNAYTDDTEGMALICVETMLLHSSGEYVKSHPLKFKAQSSMQDMGGQITYMKRYSLSAMLGIATEEDDDANGAVGNEYKITTKTATPKQIGKLKAVVKEFALLKQRKDEDVYQALKEKVQPFDNIEKLSSSVASEMIKKVQEWIDTSKQGA